MKWVLEENPYGFSNRLLFYAKYCFCCCCEIWVEHIFTVSYAYIEICILHKHCSFLSRITCWFHSKIWIICLIPIKYMILNSARCKWSGTVCFVPIRGTRVTCLCFSAVPPTFRENCLSSSAEVHLWSLASVQQTSVALHA